MSSGAETTTATRRTPTPRRPATFDDRRFGGPIGELVASDAGARAREPGRDAFSDRVDSRRRHRHRPRRAAARPRRRQRHGRRCLERDAGRRPAARRRRGRRRCDFCRRRPRARVSGSQLRRGGQPARADAHAAVAAVHRRAVPRRRPAGRSSTIRRRTAPRRSSRWRAASLHAVGVRTEPYRVFTDRAIADAFARHGFRIRSVHRQFVLPIASAQGHRIARASRSAIEELLDRAGLLGLFGSPVTLVAERCASS